MYDMIDVDEQISTVRRELGSRVLEAGEARVSTISRAYDAEIEDVWDACTNPERLPRWFLPVSGDLRLNGHYRLEGNAEGTIQRCDPPNGFAATWEYGGNVSWIEVRLSREAAGRTRLELEHVAHVDEEFWTQYGPGATGVGWDSALLGLAIHLTTGKSASPEESEAWMATEEGRRFVSLSSQEWCEASIRAGTDPAEARAAAERTTAFYTPAPEESAGD